MSKHNGHKNTNKHKNNNNGRICAECGKSYRRSNRFRMWRMTVERDASELPKYQKVDVKLCLSCFDNRQVKKVIGVADLSTRVIRMIGFNK